MYVCIEYVYNSEAKTCKSGGSLEVGRVERGGERLTVPETVDTNQNCLQSLMSSEGTLTDPHSQQRTHKIIREREIFFR